MLTRVAVLMIEDDADIAEMYRLGLEPASYSVSVAASGREGLKLARAGSFDLVILDIMMPGMDGMTVLEAIRADPRMAPLPVLILSNSDLGREQRDRARRLGVLGWLTKVQYPPIRLARRLARLVPTANRT